MIRGRKIEPRKRAMVDLPSLTTLRAGSELGRRRRLCKRRRDVGHSDIYETPRWETFGKRSS